MLFEHRTIHPKRNSEDWKHLFFLVSPTKGGGANTSLNEPLAVVFSWFSLEAIMTSVAEHCHDQQRLYLECLGSFCRAWQQAQTWVPVACLWHVKYDETPAKLRVRTAPLDSKAVAQTAKVYVCESDFTLILRRPAADTLQSFLCLRGGLSPQLRVSETGTGSAVMTVLSSCMGPPSAITKTFPINVRAVEADGLSANGKGERLLQSDGEAWSGWWHFTTECMAHKVHQSATRVFQQLTSQTVVSGITNMALLLSSGGKLSEVRKTMMEVLSDQLSFVRAKPDLSDAALTFKCKALKHLSPNRSLRRS